MEEQEDSLAWVTSLLQDTIPDLDEDLREYLIPLLLQPLEETGSEDDADAADEDWRNMIQEMLQEYPTQAQELIAKIVQRAAASASTAIPPAPASTTPRPVHFRLDDNHQGLSSLHNQQQQQPPDSPPSLVDEEEHEASSSSSPLPPPTTTTSSTATNSASTKKVKHSRKALRHPKGKASKDSTHDNNNNNTSASVAADAAAAAADLEFWDDDATAWQERQELGQAWGGRGYGGRGVRGDVNTAHNLHLVNVSITLPSGQELLQNATIQINGPNNNTSGGSTHHIYGLIGRNGCGKSTLLRRLYQKAIPGMPRDMSMVLVQQQVAASATQTALECVLQADVQRSQLLQEQEELERQLEGGDEDAEHSATSTSNSTLAEVAQRLNDVTTQLDLIEADTAPDRATAILQGLQFTSHMMKDIPTEHLSGGWRMRLALAKALFAGAHADVWLLDEVTNHLDLHAQVWLTQYLQQTAEPTVIVVSHDRAFLDAVCTDIMVLEHGKLHYHVGNYSDYERQQEEKAAREAQIVDAAERQRSKAEAFIQSQQQQQNSKSADPNKQRQAKMMKDKKLERIGNYREDGKRYKLRSLKKLSEDHLRLAQKVEVEVDEPIVKLRFPNPSWPPGIHQPDSTVVRLEDFSFGYSMPSSASKQPAKLLLQDVTLQIQRSSKIAMVGKNGAGKSTLLKLIAGEIDTAQHYVKGELWRHANLRIGHVTQYSVEELESVAASMTVVEYAEEKLRSGKASSGIVQAASGNVRQYLGGFGLGGKHALRPIGTLSGGERMRLCFATVLAEEPHLLILDESTNHLDLETLDALAAALKAFQGAVVMVSHNQGFLNGFCQGLWILGENGRIEVRYCDEDETFDDMFTQYRDELFSGSASQSRSSKRQQKAVMAKRAANQSANARGHTSLI